MPVEIQSLEAVVVGTLLESCPDKLPTHIGRLIQNAPESFDDLQLGAVAVAIRLTAQAGSPVNSGSIREYLPPKTDLPWLVGVSKSALPLDLAELEAETLFEKFRQRQTKSICDEASAALASAPGQAQSIAASVRAALDRLESENPHADAIPAVIDAADFLADEIEPPAELVAGILHRGSKLAFGGSSKSFKTWSLLDLALSVATGRDWLGFSTEQGKVLFVNFEIQPHAWQSRLVAVSKAKGISLERGQIQLLNLRGHAADFRTLIPKIIERAKREAFALVVLDPIYKLYGGTDENAAGDVAELLNAIERLASVTGAAVAFGAHFAKGNASAKEAIDRISGSGVFARDPDSLLIFTKHEADDAFTVEPILRNFAPVEPFAVRWQFPLMHRADDLDPSKLKQVGGRKPENSPEDLLKLLPPGGLTNPEWRTVAKEDGISERTFYRLRKSLEKAEKVLLSKPSEKWLPISKK